MDERSAVNTTSSMGEEGTLIDLYSITDNATKAHLKRKICIRYTVISSIVVSVVIAVTLVVVLLDSPNFPTYPGEGADIREFDRHPFFHLTKCNNMKIVGEWVTVKREGGGGDVTTPNTTQVALFQSVPFAEPPTGDLRLRSPVDTPCPGVPVWNASDVKPRCLQAGYSTHPTSGSEDCLYLTIHVPERILRRAVFPTTNNVGQAPGDGGGYNVAPVLSPMLTYIFGGSLVSGYSNGEPLSFLSANTPPPSQGAQQTTKTTTNGDGLTPQDPSEIVVVAPNYRLGGLGWLSVRSMEQEIAATTTTSVAGNFGLQDQLSAMRWAKEHISCLGGDPTRQHHHGRVLGRDLRPGADGHQDGGRIIPSRNLAVRQP